MSIPVVETERLVLRGYRREDFPTYAAMRADPAVMRHIADGEPKSEEEAWSNFLRMAGLWQVVRFGSWAIEEKANGRLIGGLGFEDRKRDRGPAFKDIPEMGWLFASESWGKGYATEAIRAALIWGRSHFGAVRVIALTAPENLASIRVAQKCGFEECARILSTGRPRIVLDRIL